MIYDDNFSEKKRQKNILAFLQNGKYHFLNSMGYQQSATSHSKRGSSTITKGIFGAPLKSASLCGSTNSFGLTVPDPVFRCFEEIIKRGLLTEGIFRLSGAAPEVESLLLDFDKPPTYGKYLDLKDNDIHAITGVVKKYLRHLPDPAIPIATHDNFIQLYDESLSDQSTIETLASMLHRLPKEHFHLIHYIIILASNIQHHADVNMMNPEALAIVLAPVCTGLEHNLKEIPSWVKRHSRAKMMTDMSHFIETNAKWTRLWTLMIEHSDKLLDIWKHVPLWEVRTVPCHPSAFHSSSTASSHNEGRHSTTLSPLEQTELLLDIAPQRRPSYHSQRSDELYKVVVMRSRQNTCKSLKKNSSSTTSRRSPPLIMDDSSMKVPTTPKRHSMVHTSS
ncbi:hypothetical protein PS15m_010176 [Mucor circinelloides]